MNPSTNDHITQLLADSGLLPSKTKSQKKNSIF
jgi:hypothetical protein